MAVIVLLAAAIVAIASAFSQPSDTPPPTAVALDHPDT
jgi:hypothetical protein